MNEGKKPVKAKEMPWSRVGEVYLLVDEEIKKTHSLDPISFLVWIQCDGKTDIEQIVDVFSVNGNRDIIKAAITGILDKLANARLVKWV